MTENTVTFQTILDTARETPKAVKIYGGNYLPKAQISYVVIGITTRDEVVRRGKKVTVEVQIIDLTLPKWLANKL